MYDFRNWQAKLMQAFLLQATEKMYEFKYI